MREGRECVRSVRRKSCWRSWTLLEGNWKLVTNKTGATWLDFCLMLKFFELEGRFPDLLEEVPQAAVEYAAGLVIPAADFAKYSLIGRTAEHHRAQVREALRFRPAPLEDEEQLTTWLATEVCPVELVGDRQREALLVECRARSIEPPGRTRIEKVLVAAARNRCEQVFCARASERLGEVGMAWLLALAAEDNEDAAGAAQARLGRGRSGLPADRGQQAERRAQTRAAREAVRGLLGEAGGRVAGTGDQGIPSGLRPPEAGGSRTAARPGVHVHSRSGPSRSPTSTSSCVTQARNAVSARSRSLTTRPIERSPQRHSETISALNSGVDERRGRGFSFPMLSMMDIILPRPKPLISDVRQSGSSQRLAWNFCVLRRLLLPLGVRGISRAA